MNQETKMKRNPLQWTVGALALFALLLGVGWAAPAGAQTVTNPNATWTPAGTTITNTATATFTDTQGNTYDPVSGSVDVVVGFKAGIMVSNIGGPYTVESGEATYVRWEIMNTGNGDDTPNISAPVLTGGFYTEVQYCFTHYNADGTEKTAEVCSSDFGTLVFPVLAPGEYLVLDVKYTVAPGYGGTTGTVELSAASTEDGTVTDSAGPTDVTVTLAGAVTVTPDDQAVSQLPSNPDGTAGNTTMVYTATFTVTNGYTGTITFDIDGAFTGTAFATVGSPYLCSDGTKTAITTLQLLSGASRDVCVDYQVDDVAGGTEGSITLTATYGMDSDPGSYDVTVIRPVLSITKTAYYDNAGVMGGVIDNTNEAARPKPGDVIWYTIEVSNGNSSSAPASIEISDPLPAQVTATGTYYSGDEPVGKPLWNFTGTTDTLLKAALTELGPGDARVITFKVTIN
jgi:hypothetical protein